MYNAFFGFQKAPFASTPDPEFFFRSKQHDAALRGLLLSVENRMGLISLVGDAGTGKTAVLECLRNSLGPDVPCAFVRDSRVSFDQFMKTIASDLDLDLRSNTASARQVFLALIRLATQQAQSGRTVVLLVDEAHNLPADVFAEIIHTASLQHDKVKAIQTVFAGRPELQPRLAALNPDRVKQRAILSRSLQAFTARETQEYIEFRLACAGMPKQTVFPRKVLEEIYDRSQGFAPAIHALCEGLLLEAFSTTSKICTREIRDQVFKAPRRNPSKIIEDAPIIVVAAGIDPSRLAPPRALAPQPPPMQTALLRVAVDARLGSLHPLLVSTDERPAYLAGISLSIAFPNGRFASAGTELALGTIQPMPPAGLINASIFGPSMGLGLAISFIPVTGLLPRLPKSAAAEVRPPSAPQLPARKLSPLEGSVRLGPKLTGAPADASPLPFTSIPEPMHPAAGLQPASIVPCSRVPLTPIRTTKHDSLACTAAHADPSPLPFASIPQPMQSTLGLQLASIVPCSRVPMTPIRTTKHHALDCTAAHADAFLLPLASIPQPMHPTASLQPASIVPCSLVPLAPIKHDGIDCAAAHAGASLLPLASIPQPMHPTAGLQSASIVPASRIPLTPIRTIKHDGLTCTAAHAGASPLPLASIPQPMHPTAGLQPANIVPASRIPLTPIRTIKHDELACTAVHADSLPLPLASIPQPMHPAAHLQPASGLPCSHVPLAPHAPLPLSVGGFFAMEPANLIPAGRPAATVLRASLHTSVEGPNRLLPLAFTAQPVPPPVKAPIRPVLGAQPYLQPHRPVSGLKPADPAKPSLFLPSTWIPLIANAKIPWESRADASTGTGKRPASSGKPLLAFGMILAGLALYGAPPALRAAADASRQGWQRAQRAVLNRAAVALDEDFRAGLGDWTNRGGSAPSWTSDASGFVSPGALALYRPSLGMVDYQMQFIGTIDKKGLSWVARATDFNNYYVIRLTVLKPGPLPSIGVTRYAVINGIPQKQFTTPLLMSAQADTVYHVLLDIQGDQFALSIQDQPVDSWSEPRLGRGSIGFFSEKDAESRIAGLHVRGHYDMLGRLCAFLMPSSISNYR